MVICPQWESKSQRLEPMKEKVEEKKSKMKIEKVTQNGPSGDEIYLESLILVRHLNI
jgi:hypothetical protein